MQRQGFLFSAIKGLIQLHVDPRKRIPSLISSGAVTLSRYPTAQVLLACRRRDVRASLVHTSSVAAFVGNIAGRGIIVDPAALKMLPREMARRYRAVASIASRD